MKIKKSTIIILVISWILFLGACLVAFYQLEQMKEARITNEKIFKDKSTEQISDEPEEYAEVREFMADYYSCIQNNDQQKLKSMVEDSQEMKKQQDSLKQYIEEYQSLIYKVESVEDTKDYIVYVSYQLKIKGIKTPAPGMTPYYLMRQGDSFVIRNNEDHDTDAIRAAKQKSLARKENQDLIQKVNEDYEEAVKSDDQLKDFLKDE
mgnify:FL=1|nr:hypothetical protein [uncultured Anaerostipes sp.]